MAHSLNKHMLDNLDFATLLKQEVANLGRGLLDKQQVLGWGESVVEMVAVDLRRAFPGMRGFSANNLWPMRQFFSEYSAAGFLEDLVQEATKTKRQFPRQLAPKPLPHASVHRPGGSAARRLAERAA